jgi:hypothetical protein
MTEKEKLISFLKKGYQPHMIVREIPKKEVRIKLPEPYLEKKVFALPLRHNQKENLMFYFTKKETLAYAKKLVEGAKTIIGYDLCVYCSVTSLEAIQGREVHFDSVIKSLKEIKGWEVEESEYANVFEVHFKIDGNNNKLLKRYVEEVREIALILSLKNKMGLTVNYYSPGTKYKAQPFSLKIGLAQTNLNGIQEQDLQDLSKLYNGEKCREATSALRLIYSQINTTSKITIAWAALEKLFRTKPQHLLSKKELGIIDKKLQELEIEESKLEVIEERIKNPNIMTEKSRNERIAKGISDLLNKDYKSTLKQVRGLSKARGKLVHTLGKTSDIKEHLDFIENILHSYIQLHCNVSLSN